MTIRRYEYQYVGAYMKLRDKREAEKKAKAKTQQQRKWHK